MFRCIRHAAPTVLKSIGSDTACIFRDVKCDSGCGDALHGDLFVVMCEVGCALWTGARECVTEKLKIFWRTYDTRQIFVKILF